MIDTQAFYDYLLSKNFNFFTGVPDSLLKNFCACIKKNSDSKHNIIAANEGNAIALAAGYHISSHQYGVVYMQNSGIGNAVNPLLSLVDEEVYRIPMLLIVGWRGEPGVKDEPQHVKQGKVTLELFEAMGIETIILKEDFEEQIDYCANYMKECQKPIALIVRKGIFRDYPTEKPQNPYSLLRESALKVVLDYISEDSFLVSTTGKTSREIFEIRQSRQQPHHHDFLTVGSMGHTSSIALGMSLATDKNVYCLDGDGSFIMHMGSSAIAASVAGPNFKYILINNGAHESVGGQPTVAFRMNIKNLLLAVGFQNVQEAENEEEIKTAMQHMDEPLSALIIYTKCGSREDLGRPTISPVENKLAMMEEFRKEEK